MISKMIRNGIIHAASDPVSVQSSKLIMAMAQHYVPEESMVKIFIGDIVIDFHPDIAERVFHLPKSNNYFSVSYDKAGRWYRDHMVEAKELVQKKYLIKATPHGRTPARVDLTRGYMIADMGYCIMLLSRVMGLVATSHLEEWMVHFIEKIRTGNDPIDWANLLSDSLHIHLTIV